MTLFIIFSIILAFFILLAIFMIAYYIIFLIMGQKEHEDIEELESEFLILYTKKYVESLKKGSFQVPISKDKEITVNVFCKGNPKSAKKIIIFHHGIRCNHKVSYKYLRLYMDKNIMMLGYDARGWGESKHIGKISYGYNEKYDLRKVVKFIKKEFPNKPIGLHGESMGGGTCYQFLTSFNKEKLINFAIIESGFVSFFNVLRVQAKINYPFLPFILIYPFIRLLWILKQKFNLNKLEVIEDLHKITIPLLAIASEADCMVPFSEHNIIRRSITNISTIETLDSPHVMTISMYFELFETTINEFLKNSDKYWKSMDEKIS